MKSKPIKTNPRRLPEDSHSVVALLNESERLSVLANEWTIGKAANPIGAQKAFELAWAMAVAGSWLRCHEKGEFKSKKNP